VIRPAASADVPGIASVHARAWHSAYAGILPAATLDAITVEQRTRMWAAARLDDRPAERPVFVAVVADAIVGMVTAGPPRERDMPYAAELYALNIDPDYWRHGIGRRLFLRCAAHLSAAGTRSLYLWAFVANRRARDFYESLGGMALEDSVRNLYMDGVPVPEIAYGWREAPTGA